MIRVFVFMSILPLLNHLGPGLFEELDGFGFQGSQDSRPRRILFSRSDDVWFPLVAIEPGIQRRRPEIVGMFHDVPHFCGTVIHPKMDPLQLDM